MKTTLTVLLVALSCFLLLSQCGKDEDEPFCNAVKLNNKTDKDVYLIVSYDYPDTSLNFQSPLVNPSNNIIKANSIADIKDLYNLICADYYFDSNPDDTLSFFVFDAALVNTTPWLQIRQNYRIMKRFDVGKDDVRNNNNTLILQ